jgi:hypothetical protein
MLRQTLVALWYIEKSCPSAAPKISYNLKGALSPWKAHLIVAKDSRPLSKSPRDWVTRNKRP